MATDIGFGQSRLVPDETGEVSFQRKWQHFKTLSWYERLIGNYNWGFLCMVSNCPPRGVRDSCWRQATFPCRCYAGSSSGSAIWRCRPPAAAAAPARQQPQQLGLRGGLHTEQQVPTGHLQAPRTQAFASSQQHPALYASVVMRGLGEHFSYTQKKEERL
jgi:hypothetical protein